MINYWSFTNNVDDSIGIAHLYDGVNAFLANDRFGYNNSALRLNSGYYCVPPGVYFSGPFTASVWVNAKSYSKYARVFDFSVNVNNDNIVFAMFRNGISSSYFAILYGSSVTKELNCESTIVLNEWIHLAVTFNGSLTNFYYNGISSGSSLQLTNPNNAVRNLNYIGKSNWPQDELVNAVFDELRIYNRSLTQSEIYDLMYF